MILRFFIALAVLIFTSFSVSAYMLLCLTNGQSTGHYTCEHTHCNVCVDELGYSTKFTRCDTQCNFLNSSGADFQAPHITIHSPLGNQTYNEAGLLLDISTDESAKLYLFDNSNSRKGFVQLSDYTTQYSRSRRFAEGLNSFIVKAKDHKGNEAFQHIDFWVDTQEPRIEEVVPEDGSYISGTVFTVFYNEENLQQIQLHYGINADDHTVPLSGCPSGDEAMCSIDLDLSSYDGQLIQFYFTVSDLVNHINSEVFSITIDDSAPIIDLHGPQSTDYGSNKVVFDVQLNEQVMELNYINWDDSKPKPKKLCHDCLSYNKEKTFKEGSHHLTFTAIDYAGNTANRSVNFTTDSKKPTIKKTNPKNNAYNDGNFSVEYTEMNLQEMLLTIVDQVGGYHEYNVPGCPMGENQHCGIVINAAPFEGQTISYYFTASDLFFSQTSKIGKGIMIDTIAPSFISVVPAENQVYGSSSVDLHVEISEPGEIIYTIDGESPKKLCSKCSSNEKTIKLKNPGTHLIEITATDFAGNSASITRHFETH